MIAKIRGILGQIRNFFITVQFELENGVEYDLEEDLKDELEEEETGVEYSVLLHFTPHATLIYIIEDESFSVDHNYVSVTIPDEDEGGTDLEVSGSFVCKNGLDSWEGVEKFIKRYQPYNPIAIKRPNIRTPKKLWFEEGEKKDELVLTLSKTS